MKWRKRDIRYLRKRHISYLRISSNDAFSFLQFASFSNISDGYNGNIGPQCLPIRHCPQYETRRRKKIQVCSLYLLFFVHFKRETTFWTEEQNTFWISFPKNCGDVACRAPDWLNFIAYRVLGRLFGTPPPKTQRRFARDDDSKDLLSKVLVSYFTNNYII